jgi:hypothetical protein
VRAAARSLLLNPGSRSISSPSSRRRPRARRGRGGPSPVRRDLPAAGPGERRRARRGARGPPAGVAVRFVRAPTRGGRAR